MSKRTGRPSGRPSTWKPDEISFLRDQAGHMTSRGIAEVIGKTAANVRRRARDLGLSLKLPRQRVVSAKKNYPDPLPQEVLRKRKLERMLALSFRTGCEAVSNGR